MSPQEFERIFGPAQVFEPGGEDLDMMRIMYQAGYGGFVNLPIAAIDYAHVLMTTSGPRLSSIPKEDLRIEERGGIWHVTVTHALGFTTNGEVLSFSRTTGNLLSGGL